MKPGCHIKDINIVFKLISFFVNSPKVSKYLEEEFEMHSTEVKEQDFVQEMDYGHVRMKEEDSIQHACSTNSLANVSKLS